MQCKLFLLKEWMQFDLPRHEQRTPLTAVLTAENLFAELVIAKSWIDYLKDISCLVGYYIINFEHTITVRIFLIIPIFFL